MRRLNRLGTVVAAGVMLAVGAVPSATASDITVADFVKRLAAIKNLNALDARAAADSLATVGIRLPADIDFSRRLTEADVVRISRAAGLNVRTSNPLNDFSNQQTDMFFITFKDDLGGEGNGTRSHTNPGLGGGPPNSKGFLPPPFDPFTKGKHGKGKGKGTVFTPTDPE